MAVKIEITVPSVSLVNDKKHLKQVLRAAGNEIAAHTRSLIRGSKGGGPRGASLPGQPPRSLSGTLANSIKTKMLRSGEGVSIRDMAFYALALEGGAKGGGGNTTASNLRMAGSAAHGRYGKILGKNRQITKSMTRVLLPRPFLSLALEQDANSISDRIKTAVLDGIKFERKKFR